VIPLFHLPRQWVAYWSDLKRPAKTPLYGYQIDTWWMEPASAGNKGASALKP
jgi:peptide/nickel transport system substrate-binding protein